MKNGMCVGCVSVMVVLFIVPIAGADFVLVGSDGYQVFRGDNFWFTKSPETSWARTESNHQSPDNMLLVWGNTFHYTTESGDFEWQYQLYARAEAWVRSWEQEYARAAALALASVTVNLSNPPYYHYDELWAEVDIKRRETGSAGAGYDHTPYPSPGYFSTVETAYFPAMEGINTENMMLVYAEIEGEWDGANAETRGTARSWIWEPW